MTIHKNNLLEQFKIFYGAKLENPGPSDTNKFLALAYAATVDKHTDDWSVLVLSREYLALAKYHADRTPRIIGIIIEDKKTNERAYVDFGTTFKPRIFSNHGLVEKQNDFTKSIQEEVKEFYNKASNYEEYVTPDTHKKIIDNKSNELNIVSIPKGPKYTIVLSYKIGDALLKVDIGDGSVQYFENNCIDISGLKHHGQFSPKPQAKNPKNENGYNPEEVLKKYSVAYGDYKNIYDPNEMIRVVRKP